MNYSLEKISTVLACDSLLASAQKRKENLECKRRNLGEVITKISERIDHIANKLASVQMLLHAFTSALDALPEGSKNKAKMTIKIKRLEVHEAQLNKMSLTFNVNSLVKKQVDYNRIDSQVLAIAGYVAAIQHKKTQLTNTASFHPAGLTLLERPAYADHKKVIFTGPSVSSPVAKPEKPRAGNSRYIYPASFKAFYAMRTTVVSVIAMALLWSCSVSTGNFPEPEKLKVAIAKSIKVPGATNDTLIYSSFIGICGNSSAMDLCRISYSRRNMT